MNLMCEILRGGESIVSMQWMTELPRDMLFQDSVNPLLHARLVISSRSVTLVSCIIVFLLVWIYLEVLLLLYFIIYI